MVKDEVLKELINLDIKIHTNNQLLHEVKDKRIALLEERVDTLLKIISKLTGDPTWLECNKEVTHE
jgi:hypothetical protein